jgi:hypothetical protein
VIGGVFFDECHNIVTSSDFRAMYVICVKQNFKFTKVVFLSGSLPLNVLNSLRGSLSHIPDCDRFFRDIITTPQSRDEIYLHFQTVTSNQNFKHLHFILGLMHNWRDRGDVSGFPQFLIYVDSLANLRDLFDWFHTWCPDAFRHHIMKYCKSMGDDESKKRTTELFRNGHYKVLLSTKLAGEGLNFLNLNVVILQGYHREVSSHLLHVQHSPCVVLRY